MLKTCHLENCRRRYRGGHGNPLQYSCLQNPMDWGAWQATVRRVARSWTWLKRLSCSRHRRQTAVCWQINKLIHSIVAFASLHGVNIPAAIFELPVLHPCEAGERCTQLAPLSWCLLVYLYPWETWKEKQMGESWAVRNFNHCIPMLGWKPFNAQEPYTNNCPLPAPIVWPLDMKTWLFGKDPDAGKDWGQEEKGIAEDEIVR